MSGRHRIRAVIRYRVDNLLSRGTWAVLLWLAAVTAAAVLVSGALLAIFGVTLSGSEDGSFLEDLWQSILRTLDSGTMAADTGWGPRILALVVTLFGILVAGTLIGLIASGVEQRVDQMQRGRSTVVESGHVVVLGASSRLPIVVEQLAIAGRHRGANTIVVLSEEEPHEVREAIGAASGLHGSRLVIRAGRSDRVADLAMVNVAAARSVLVVSEEDDGDTGAVNAVLAVGAASDGFGRMPIVVELTEPAMGERLVRACGPSVHPLLAALAIARVTAFSMRQPGVHGVIDELLDARGSDIHVTAIGELAGVAFGEIVRRFDSSRPIGLIRADGTVILNPSAALRPDASDQLVVVAPELRLAVPTPAPFAPATQAPAALPGPPPDRHEHLLVVGWNGLGAILVAAIEEFSAPGSSVEVVYDPDLFDVDEIGVPGGGSLDVTLTASERLTWELGSGRSTPTSIVLLGYRHGLSAAEADSRTMLSLMLLRQELDRRGGPAPRVIVELRDPDNVPLAQRSGADDYIVSDAVASRLMTQLIEQPLRRPVLLTLYAPGGPSIRVVPATDLGLGGTVRFDQVVSVAQAAGLLAIGWRDRGDRDVALNPPVSTTWTVRSDSQVVVIG